MPLHHDPEFEVLLAGVTEGISDAIAIHAELTGGPRYRFVLAMEYTGPGVPARQCHITGTDLMARDLWDLVHRAFGAAIEHLPPAAKLN